MAELFMIFNDPEHTVKLTRDFDEVGRDYDGFTLFKGLELMGNGCVVVRLLKG
jgi:hypothetical protein